MTSICVHECSYSTEKLPAHECAVPLRCLVSPVGEPPCKADSLFFRAAEIRRQSKHMTPDLIAPAPLCHRKLVAHLAARWSRAVSEHFVDRACESLVEVLQASNALGKKRAAIAPATMAGRVMGDPLIRGADG